MPATEQTWRDLKVLHVVFGVSALALLVATVAMLAVDHNRPWKKYQREFRELETWTAAARVEEAESQTFTEMANELEAALAESRRARLDASITAAFFAQAETVAEDAEAVELARADVGRLSETTDPDERFVLRGDLLAQLRDVVDRCSYREEQAAGRLKLLRAEFDKARADFELAVAASAPQRTLDELQARADAATAEVTEATRISQADTTHRKALEQLLRGITSDEDAAAKALADHRQSLEMLSKTRDEKAANLGKTILELPVLDAFNSPLRIDQIWLPDLTFNNNFRDVARFDRCTTCHQGIDKTDPGNPLVPGYPETDMVTIALATPEDPAAGDSAVEAETTLDVAGDGNNQLERLYGLRLADQGVFHADDPTVAVVRPGSAAAIAGLKTGDVIVSIDGGRTYARDVAVAGLIESPSWGTSLALVVRRGVPQPYASHPRLDLFVGSLSPHPKQVFGCTICHEGQGSATSFKWASHTPSSPQQARDWHDAYGWFDNHHWIYPMHSERFEESSCLKCHHQVIDLEPSSTFPEPPAAKLVEGYHTIREYGCYGCHEINGYAGPKTRVGPDMRLAPNFHEVAEALLADPGLADLAPTAVRLADDVRSSPDTARARATLATMIKEDAASGDEAVLTSRSHALGGLLDDPETPGTLPKVGPSLRYLSSKVSFDWLYSWLRNPMDFRPSTKMPRFFGLWDHLSGAGLAESQRYEPIEIRSIIAYLDAASAPFEYVAPYEGITAEQDPERGRKVFQVRGCLACHQHEEFPEATNNQGPDLSRIGAKLSSHPNGEAWLYSWLREPGRYHPKTLMPNVLLEPVTLADGTVSDPAADATAWLMQSTQDWQPTDIPAADALTADERAATEELAALYLEGRFTKDKAHDYSINGLPESMATIAGDESMLVGLSSGEATRDRQLLEYVGKKTIGKLGCYSCHAIPGFEDAKPAGAALADWGRKESSKIAFEQIVPYVMKELGGHAHGGDEEHAKHASEDDFVDPVVAVDLAYADTREHHVSPESVDPDTGYFLEKMLAHDRQGFLWQKLRAPRSYDYQKTANKTYNERYRMPQFPFDEKQREAVMTFVLGLVAEPPAEEFLHRPDPREQARLDGLTVLEQFNCGGCHVLEAERWDIRYAPDSISDPPVVPDYAFLQPHFPQEELTASLAIDNQNRRFASLHGLPVLDAETGEPQLVDQDFIPIDRDEADEDPEIIPHRGFMLYQDAIINGEPWAVGSQTIFVPEDALEAGTTYPAKGGDLARLLFPVVIEDELEINPNVKPDDAWGWLPPPLVGEGTKVQSSWLHTFLLAPEPIRPAAVLRMPRFHLSSEQASALVNYFAAVDSLAAVNSFAAVNSADFPYDYDPRYESSTLTERETEYPAHLTDAMRIVTNGNYCVKCHLLGDYAPPGNPKALAPQLSVVHQRLRPDYVHGWIGNPKRFLPYTGMPVNIPFDKPVSQDLYRGDSEQQLSALTDLLMHYDTFTGRRMSLDAFLQAPSAEAASGESISGDAATADRLGPPDAPDSARTEP
jgi:cytochrome c2